MKSYKKMSQNQLIGLLTLLFVVVLGVGLYIAYTPEVGTEEEAFDPNEAPPLVQIDAGYNATLSGEPFYIVDDTDEDFDDSLDVCNEFGTDSYRRGVQNGWYQVVAYQDNMTVEEVIFEQVDLEEGDKMVAVVYDAEDQEWKAWPNRIIVDKNGNNVELLDRDDELDKGTVVSVSADRDVDYCSDYAEIGDHENIELRWNLVSRPDFDDVDYRTIWEVAFAKGGNSGVDLERYYSSDDPSNSTPPNQLPDDQLYWVYGGQPSTVTDGGEPADPNESDEQRIVVKVNNTNAAGQRDVVEGETFQINEDGGELRYSVGLAQPADGNVELEFEIYEDTQLVAVESAEEIASRTTAGGAAFARGKNYSDGENTLTAFVLEAIDDNLAEIPKAVEFRVVDKAGNLDDVRFNIKIVDDELGGTVCTQELRYGVALEVKGLADNVINDARVLAFTADGTIVSESNGTLGGETDAFYNNGVYYLLPEAEGAYTIRVEKAGIQSEEIDVTLVKDECHVITQSKTVILKDRVAQTVDLTVTVTDAVTGDVVNGANVMVEGTTLGGTTNFDGEVQIDGAPESGRVNVSFVGYDSASINISENSEGNLTVQLTPSVQASFGPGLELVSSQISPSDFIQVSIASGYEIDSLCGLDDTCTITINNNTRTYSATNGLYAQTSPDGVISFYIRENSSTVDFAEGVYTLVVEGAEYKNNQLVPRFEEAITVQ